MTRYGIAIGVFVCALGGWAQIRGPVAGVVWDEATRSVRQIMGVPGAAYYATALAAGLEQAVVSPGGHAVLASREGKLLALRLTEAGIEEQFLGEGALGAAAWSADSSRVAFVAGGELYEWRWGADSATRLGPATGVRAVAVDGQDGAIVVARAGALEAIRVGESARLLAVVRDPLSLVLGRGGAAFVADGGDRRLLRIDVAGGGAQLVAVDAGDPVAVALSADGQLLLVADRERHRVMAYRVATQEHVSQLELDFAPSLLEPIGEGLFLLERRALGRPAEIVALRQQLAAYFVPAPEVE